MNCPKCKDELFTVKGLTEYDRRDGIREARYCNRCHILFGSHAHGLNKVAQLANISRLTAAVKALVGVSKLVLHNTPCQGFYPDCDCVRCKFKQAIAAVERLEME